MKNFTEQDIKISIHESDEQAQYEVAKVPFHQHNGIDSARVRFSNLIDAPNFFCVASTSSGATPISGSTAVNVFGSGGAKYPLKITGVFLVSNDTTAANINLYNNSATVATIAKGTTAGVLTGATSLSNVKYTKGTPMTITSSSAGNATLFMTFTV